MQYQTFSEHVSETYPVAILVPKLEADGITREYIEPGNLNPEEVIAYLLHTTGKKTKRAVQKEFLDDILPVLKDMGTKYIIISDGEYFKTLTGVAKTEAYLGYLLPNIHPTDLAGQFHVLFCPNFRQVFYDPGKTRAKITQSLNALWSHRHGQYAEPGESLLTFEEYPQSVADIAIWLEKIKAMKVSIACDIEAFSLRHYDAGIATIAFAWSQTEGIAFAVDLSENAKEIRRLLLDYFTETKQRIRYHNITYDVGVLIYQLFMKDLLDTAGLLDGMDVMLKKWDCTKLISYLATNSCSGNELSLKAQAQEFAGNYAVEEIDDVRKIPLPELLRYNLVDACSTHFVYEKNWDKMVEDEQLNIYETIFKPAVLDIVQMQLTGMPVDLEQVAVVKDIFTTDSQDALNRITSHPLVREFVYMLNEEWVAYKNNTLKVKRVTMADAKEEFNPNSSPQKARLLYDMIGLPIIETTKANQPATKASVITKLKAHTTDQSVKDLLDAMLDFGAVDKLLNTFIPALEGAKRGPNGFYYLFGFFNLGGTVSGRLSSSKPNLQTIPSSGTRFAKKGGDYAKLIKSCFKAPPGYLMVGLDYDSLEDRISALTTKDPNKLKVYTDGYDGHALRAQSYFSDQMPDIDPNDVDSINSIDEKYPNLRQDSKMPTFLLTYGGTYIGMMAQGNFTQEEALQISDRYHNLYKVSDQWVSDRLDEAAKCGYIVCAFGLRVRTPLLHQVVRGTSATPYEAEAEGRTAGNALGQSWGLLNSRAASEFMAKVRKSKYRLQIHLISLIHDAGYLIIPDDIEILRWVNKHYVKAVQWQDDPAIEHPTVKLSGKLALYHPSWAYEKTLPNNASDAQVYTAVAEHMAKLQKKKVA